MSLLERVQQQQARPIRSDEKLAPYASKERSRVREKLKRELVERLGLTSVAQLAASPDTAQARDELKVAAQAILNTGDYEQVRASARDALVAEVLDEVVGLGPLQPLLDDPSISEVMVNGCDALFYERDGQVYAAERVFETPEQILLVVDRILSPLGRRLDESSPLVNARLPNGDRVHVVGSPIALSAPVITIRRFSERIASLDELVRLGALSGWYAQLLSWAVRLRQDIAVAGGTGSGKTTLLNALSCEIAHGERIITIEDSAELRFDTHPHVVRLEAREASREGTGQVTIRELVRNALRMRPDRIVVGEVRGAETIDMLTAMLTGHDGSLTTLHAGSEQEAIVRLVLMARFGMDLPADIIEEQVASALDLIVMSRRMSDGTRLITSCAEVDRAQEGGVELAECVSFDGAQHKWHLNHVPRFIERAVQEGRLEEQEVRQWRQTCL